MPGRTVAKATKKGEFDLWMNWAQPIYIYIDEISAKNDIS